MTFDSGTLGVVSDARYNGRGYDCRLEVHGFTDTVAAGWDQGVPVRNLTPGETFPSGRPHQFFMDRFIEAFRAELNAFLDVSPRAAGPRPAHPKRRRSRLDRRGRHSRSRSAQTRQNGRGTIMIFVLPERRFRGVYARFPAGDTSSSRMRCLARCASLVWPQPNSVPTGSCPPTPTSWRPPSTSTASRPSADSPPCWCTKPATTPCRTSPDYWTPTSPQRPR